MISRNCRYQARARTASPLNGCERATSRVRLPSTRQTRSESAPLSGRRAGVPRGVSARVPSCRGVLACRPLTQREPHRQLPPIKRGSAAGRIGGLSLRAYETCGICSTIDAATLVNVSVSRLYERGTRRVARGGSPLGGASLSPLHPRVTSPRGHGTFKYAAPLAWSRVSSATPLSTITVPSTSSSVGTSNRRIEFRQATTRTPA